MDLYSMWYSVAGVFPLEHNMSKYQYFTLFKGCIIFHFVGMSHFVYPLTTGQTSGCFRFFPLVSDGAVNSPAPCLCGHVCRSPG